MKSKMFLTAAVFVFLTFFSCASLYAIPVDFSGFDIIDPSVTVFGPDNSSASFEEDFNPPILLTQNLYIPDEAVSLTFDYALYVEADNEDYFDFYFDNLSDPAETYGGYEGIYTGTVTKDVTGFAGDVLSLAFRFTFGWDDFGFDSVLEITNAELTIAASSVPEPSCLLLLGIGLLGLAKMRKKQ